MFLRLVVDHLSQLPFLSNKGSNFNQVFVRHVAQDFCDIICKSCAFINQLYIQEELKQKGVAEVDVTPRQYKSLKPLLEANRVKYA